jgi:hypothetical protein
MLYNRISHALEEFQFPGQYRRAEELHSGHINNTYHLVYASGGREVHFALQRINSYVFKEPQKVMHNIRRVTQHLRARLVAEGAADPGRHVLELVPTLGGDALFQDGEGGFWRAYRFIENATAYDRVETPAHFYEAGRGFGMFQRRLFDFPAGELYETIPDFHNTPRRFVALMEALAGDRAGRAASVKREVGFLLERREAMGEIVKRLDSGALAVRVAHNDTKINNVMLDDDTGEAVCVIDLDTVMPGSSLYDFGDAIRFGASTAAEDEPDTDLIHLDMNLFELFSRGFFAETTGFLTRDELMLMPLGVKVMTGESALRFLTDYIDGDLYFKVKSPDHNLIRARAQMKLLTDIEQKYDRMVEFSARLAGA